MELLQIKCPTCHLLSCNLIRRIPPSIMVAVSFINVRTVLPTFLRQERLSWQA